MLELRRGARLPLEALDELGVKGEREGQDLEGDFPLQVPVLARNTMAMPPRPSSSSISYSSESASLTRSRSVSSPLGMPWMGVVPRRSRPQLEQY